MPYYTIPLVIMAAGATFHLYDMTREVISSRRQARRELISLVLDI